MKITQRRSPAQWHALIQQQADSGLSAVQFCREHDLDQQYFSKRKRRLHAQTISPGEQFIKVGLAPRHESASATTMVLHYRNTQLHIPASTDLQVLAQLMTLLA